MRLTPGMVDWVMRATFLAVLGLALVTLGRGLWLGARLGRYIGVKHARLGVALWLPIFRETRDVREWLATWRGILACGDPTIARFRMEARLIAGRYAELAATSNAWAMAISALIPRLG